MKETTTGSAEAPCAEHLEVAFTATLTPRGYRGVMLHLAARALRFAPPLVAIGGVIAYGSGASATGFTMFAALLAIPLVVWGYVSWLANSPSAKVLYTPVAWVFSGEQIGYSSAEGDGQIAWSSVTRWRNVVDHLMLYTSGSNYVLIPVEDVPLELRPTLRELLVAGAGNPPRRDDGLR
ncbi:MAG: YcxB family protein [Clostridiales bacterium]|nr:YcxB family protein [Clostridiales bacterium]